MKGKRIICRVRHSPQVPEKKIVKLFTGKTLHVVNRVHHPRHKCVAIKMFVSYLDASWREWERSYDKKKKQARQSKTCNEALMILTWTHSRESSRKKFSGSFQDVLFALSPCFHSPSPALQDENISKQRKWKHKADPFRLLCQQNVMMIMMLPICVCVCCVLHAW